MVEKIVNSNFNEKKDSNSKLKHIVKLNFSTIVEKITVYYNNLELPYLSRLNESHYKVKYAYGTSGFRMNSEYLDIVALRLGFMLSVRSTLLSLPIGLMITASHNKNSDNGFKIADLNGRTLCKEWENLCEEIVNSKNFISDASNFLRKYLFSNTEEVPFYSKVVLGWDTRTSSPHLIEVVKTSLIHFNTQIIEYGLVTSPQLHFMTFISQKQILEGKRFKEISKLNKSYLKPQEESNSEVIYPKEIYFDIYRDGSLKTFLELYDKLKEKEQKINYESHLVIDYGNGVGGTQENKDGIASLLKVIDKNFNIGFTNDLTTDPELLNEKSGTEHVQKNFTLPNEFYETLELRKFEIQENKQIKACSLDGDADRIVYL